LLFGSGYGDTTKMRHSMPQEATKADSSYSYVSAERFASRANGAAAASIRWPAYGSPSSPPANQRMEPSSVPSASVLPAGGSSAAPLCRAAALQHRLLATPDVHRTVAVGLPERVLS
jgi:hypothetical protein